jgi:hypothetical protein
MVKNYKQVKNNLGANNGVRDVPYPVTSHQVANNKQPHGIFLYDIHICMPKNIKDSVEYSLIYQVLQRYACLYSYIFIHVWMQWAELPPTI